MSETDSQLNIDQLVDEAGQQIADSQSLQALDDVRVRYLGKSGLLTAQLKQLGRLPAEERPAAGQAINQAKRSLQEAIDQRREALEQAALQSRLNAERIEYFLTRQC